MDRDRLSRIALEINLSLCPSLLSSFLSCLFIFRLRIWVWCFFLRFDLCHSNRPVKSVPKASRAVDHLSWEENVTVLAFRRS